MPRLRVAVALLVPAPFDAEVDVLRRACGDRMLGRVPPHLTLVPPVNVRAERRDEALGVLRAAAAATRPLTVILGPPTTFLPVNPVVYLPVADAEEVRALRDRVFRPPLERAITLPFVPHVTLAEGEDHDLIVAAARALAGYRVEVTFERVHLLLEADRRWSPIADATFTPPAVIGRGGLEVELEVTERLAPDVAEWKAEEWDRYDREAYGSPDHPLAVTARQEGAVVGVADGTLRGEEAQLARLVVARDRRSTGIGSHLIAAFVHEAGARGATHVTLRTQSGGGAERLYRRRGFTTVTALPGWRHGRDFVVLRRELPSGHG